MDNVIALHTQKAKPKVRFTRNDLIFLQTAKDEIRRMRDMFDKGTAGNAYCDTLVWLLTSAVCEVDDQLRGEEP